MVCYLGRRILPEVGMRARMCGDGALPIWTQARNREIDIHKFGPSGCGTPADPRLDGGGIPSG